MSETNYYKSVLLDGCSIEYHRLSICDLRDYYDFYRRRKDAIYQVHCEDSKNQWLYFISYRSVNSNRKTANTWFLSFRMVSFPWKIRITFI